jgi:tetratricopeptide (TPR) repeat protein
MGTPKVVGLLAAVALVCAAPYVEAQNELKQARKHLKRGDRHRDKGDRYRDKGKEEQAIAEFETALAEYQSAYELVANPRLYYPIAQIEERLGLDLEALTHYQKVLEESDALPDELRAEIEIAVDAVKQRLAMLTFVVEPAGAMIEVDGKELGDAPLEKPVPFIPGELVISVTKEGYKPYEETAEYDAGATNVEIFLEKKVVTVAPTPPPPPPPKPKKKPAPKGRNRLIAGAATSGGLAVTAIVTGIMAQSKHSTFEDAANSASVREDARDSGKTLALVTDILWVGAIAAGSYTAYYYFTEYKPNKERMDRRAADESVRVVPYATPDSVGLAVGGSF